MRIIYAASERCPDLLYETGFSAPDPYLYVETPDFRGIIVSALEYGRACKSVKEGIRVFSHDEVRKEFGMPRALSVDAVNVIAAISRRYADWTWEVPANFPLDLARKLEGNGVVLNCVKPFSPGRIVKTADEIEKLRHGVQLAEAGLYRGMEVLKEAEVGQDGVLTWNGETLTAEILRGEIDMAIAKKGGTAAQTITAPGTQGADPHQQGTGSIRQGQPIVMDIFPRCDATGYYGDLTRTVVKGQASDIIKKTFQAVYAAQRKAIEAIKPGAICSSIHQLAAKSMEDDGFVTDLSANPPCGFIHSLGHGLGLEIHEGPSMNSRSETVLQIGHVVTVEPGLYYPEWGGIRIEDVVAVTEDGCENLTTAPVFLEIE